LFSDASWQISCRSASISKTPALRKYSPRAIFGYALMKP
jgi:hypothetical protein